MKIPIREGRSLKSCLSWNEKDTFCFTVHQPYPAQSTLSGKISVTPLSNSRHKEKSIFAWHGMASTGGMAKQFIDRTELCQDNHPSLSIHPTADLLVLIPDTQAFHC